MVSSGFGIQFLTAIPRDTPRCFPVGYQLRSNKANSAKANRSAIFVRLCSGRIAGGVISPVHVRDVMGTLTLGRR